MHNMICVSIFKPLYVKEFKKSSLETTNILVMFKGSIFC